MQSSVKNTHLELKFSQYEFERAVHAELAFGDETLIAEKLGRSVTLVSQMCNPHDERESDLFKAAKFICAELAVNQCRGVELLQIFNLMCERHVTIEAQNCPNAAASSFMHEFSEAMQARLTDKPAHEQLKEIDDVIRQAKVFKDAILTDMGVKQRKAKIEADAFTVERNGRQN